VQRVADIEKLLLPVEFQLVQGFRTRFEAKAVELLAADANDVAEIALPTVNNPDHSAEFWEFHLIRHRQETDHHGAHLT
jgi:hypothetical protein